MQIFLSTRGKGGSLSKLVKVCPLWSQAIVSQKDDYGHNA